MKRIASFILFIYCSLTLIAQNNTVRPMYVSDNMARKIVVYIDNARPRENGANVMWLFKMANNISSTYECDKILEAIILHKDKVENFIIYVINSYGKENSYSVFRNIGYSTFEYEMALKIYDNWLVEQEAQQKAYEDYYHKTQKEYEQKTIDNWQKNGKDTLMSYSVNAPVFSVSVKGHDDTIIVYQDLSRNKLKDMKNSDLSDKYCYRTITEDKLFSFFVNENGEISNLDIDNNWLNGINEIKAIKPGYKHFDELDTIVYVPTQNYLYVEIIRNEFVNISTSNTYYSIQKINTIYKKKNDKWIIKNEKDLLNWYNSVSNNCRGHRFGKSEYFSVLGVSDYNSFIDIINSKINDKLKDFEGVKYEIVLGFKGGGIISYYLNGRLISTDELVFDMDFKSINRIK